MKRKVSAAAFVLVLALALPAYGLWELQTVDDQGSVGKYLSMAAVGDGTVYISYYDQTEGDLMVAIRDGGSWTATAVDSTGDVGRFTAITLDPMPYPHVAYQDATGGLLNLKYAFFDGTQWYTDPFDSSDGSGYYSSIAVNEDYDLYITYLNDYTQTLTLVWCDGHGAGCFTEDVYPLAVESDYQDLVVDDLDRAHISFHDHTDNRLVYGIRESDSWTFEVVDSGGTEGKSNAIALDGDRNPHLAYHSLPDADLRYAVRSAGAWTVETVQSDDWVGYLTDIALDASDVPHLVYSDLTHHEIRYATKAGDDWYTETLGGEAGDYCAIAIDDEGEIHAAYYNRTSEDLVYARFLGPGDDDDDSGDDDSGDDDAGDDDSDDDDAGDDDAGDDDEDENDTGGCGGCAL